jgi:UDP-N-acetyl-alpha-D-muramoyl-L-alanyl-L-glutamate epimerase
MDPLRRFDPGSIETFRILDRSYDPETRTALLRYAFDDGERFEETITFESAPTSEGTGPGFERALLHLHLAAGTSYYKAAAPPEVVVGEELTADELAFHHHLYDDGLREFAVTNGLPVPRPVGLLPSGTVPATVPPSGSRSGGLVVPIGGGKDSMVLIESLRGLIPRLFAVNPHPLTVALAEQTGLELIVVRRTLSPDLLALNGRGALNGHVPITAIVSLIAVVGSFLYGYDAIAMAIERSASEETVVVDGVPVNHQYSKSLEFEGLLRSLITGTIDPGLVYGSALRPYSELAIARAFAGLPQFHSTFCSCNSVFRQGADTTDRWCGDCPKCRFVALMLAPFLDPGAVAAIIGRDLFADAAQVPGFAALMSDDEKPFECVGERRESAVAFRLLADLPAWRSSAVVAALAGPARALVSPADVEAALAPSPGLAFPDPVIAAEVERLLAP